MIPVLLYSIIEADPGSHIKFTSLLPKSSKGLLMTSRYRERLRLGLYGCLRLRVLQQIPDKKLCGRPTRQDMLAIH